MALDDAQERLLRHCRNCIDAKRNQLERETARLTAYSPQKTLERGFALIQNDCGHIVSSSQEIETGDAVSIRFTDGAAFARITGKETV
jgi:exodeoxyribonuclease VII large subunit